MPERLTGSLAQAGVLPRGTPRRNLGVLLPPEPYRYPRLPQAAKTLAATRVRVLCGQQCTKNKSVKNFF